MVEDDYEKLIQALESSSHQARERARFELIALGKTAIPVLVKAISNNDPSLRWQAAKALSQINDPAVIPVLIAILTDNPYFGVRWSVSEGLVRMGITALEPLLQALSKRSDSTWLRESAHHVLHSWRDQRIKPEVIELVLLALDGVEPEVAVPGAASQALELLNKSHL